MHKFEVGSQIIYEGNVGVIKWLGYPPGCKVEMAGLEMVKHPDTVVFKPGMHWPQSSTCLVS